MSEQRVARQPAFSFKRVLPLYILFLLVLLALVELAARFLVMQSREPAIRLIVRDYARRGDAAPARFEGAPYVNYRLTPGFVQDLGPGQVTRHNAQGFRATADFPSKQGDVLRIVCVGASTTYGVGVRDNSETFPAQLERELEQPLPSGWNGIEVFNLGVGGYTSAEVLALLHFHALPLEPDVVLIHSAINDVAPRFYAHFECDYTHFRTVWQDPQPGRAARLAYRSHFVLWAGWKLKLLEPLTLQSRTQRALPPAEQALVHLQNNGTECFRRNIEGAITLAEAAGARVWLVTQAYFEHEQFRQPSAEARLLEEGYRQGLAEHNEVLREVARARGVGLIDVDRGTPRQLELFADPIHMTAAGNRFKGRYIAEHLVRDLRPDRDGSR
jgi:lysophospholipase L1-like esterase